MDQSDMDWKQMYAVDPIKDCPHCEELDFEKFADKKFNEKCKNCDNVGENWICLSCQDIFCSRYVNEHMVAHNEESKHPVALSFADLSYWCYSCDSYVISSKFDTVHAHFYKQKFGDTSKDGVAEIIDKLDNLEIQDSGENKDTSEDKTKKEENKTKEEDKEEEKKLSRDKFVENLKNGKYKYINIFTGAGISVSSGIPDFRSPKIGLYATLKEKYGMVHPEEIFSIDSFLKKPEVFYDFAKEFDWDKYDPTPTHYFIAFLNKKGLLDNYITQNIDSLELKAGLPKSKLLSAHGDLSGAECPKCHTEVPIEEFRTYVKEEKILYCKVCEEKDQKVPIKPTVVFFGEGLPTEFFKALQDIPYGDCGIVIGSSLMVSPANMIPTLFPDEASVVTINMEPIKHIERLNGPNSLFLNGKCDEVIEELIKDLGWKEEFDEFVSETKAKHSIT